VDQLQLFPFRIRNLELRVSATIREFGNIVAVIGKKDEVANGLEQRVGWLVAVSRPHHQQQQENGSSTHRP
jgi:hypothetical protein